MSSIDFKQTPTESLISGSLAGGVTPWVYQPLLNAKIEQQTNLKIDPQTKKGGSLIDAFKKLSLENRVYKGVGINSGVNCVLFGLQNSVKDKILQEIGGENPTDGEKILSSVGGGGFVSPINNINETVISRMGELSEEAIKQNKPKPTYIQVISDIYIRKGPRGFMKGIKLLMAREGFCFVPAFGYLAPKISGLVEPYIRNKWISTLIGGSLAGGLACYVSTPFDTNSTRLKRDQKVTWIPRECMKEATLRFLMGAIVVPLFLLLNESLKEVQKRSHK